MRLGEKTENYMLLKPAQEDFYDVDDFNENADIIDGALKNLEEKDISLEEKINGLAEVAQSGSYNDLEDKPTALPADGGNADTVDGKHTKEIGLSYIDNAYTEYVGAGHGYSWTSLDDIKSSCRLLISSGSGLKNMPDSQSGFLEVIAQSSIRVKQIWHNSTNNTVYIRYCSGGTWSEWENISDFAPSGFGLGTSCKFLSDMSLNDVSGTGFFMFATAAANNMTDYPVTEYTGSWWYLIQMQHNGSYKRQLAFTLQSGSDFINKIYMRLSDGSNWSDWKCVNDGGNAGSVNSVTFHPGDTSVTGNTDQPWFYCFNGGDDYNCYVKNTIDIKVGDSSKLGGKTPDEFMGDTDFVYKYKNGANQESLNDLKTEYHGFVFNCLNTPQNCGYGFLDVSKFDGTGFTPALSGVIRQIFTKWDTGAMYVRTFKNEAWSNWGCASDGGNADTVDGKHASEFLTTCIRNKWSGSLYLFYESRLTGVYFYEGIATLSGLTDRSKCIIEVSPILATDPINMRGYQYDITVRDSNYCLSVMTMDSGERYSETFGYYVYYTVTELY